MVTDALAVALVPNMEKVRYAANAGGGEGALLIPGKNTLVAVAWQASGRLATMFHVIRLEIEGLRGHMGGWRLLLISKT